MRIRSFLPLTVFTLALSAPVHAAGPIHHWSKQFSGTSTQTGYSVAVDGAGNAYVTGYFWDSIDLGGGPLASNGNSDIFLAKFSPSGAHVWSKSFGDASDNQAYSVAVSSLGDVIITGYLGGSADFGGGVLSPPGFVFLAKFDTDGNHLWSARWGQNGTESGTSVFLDTAGNACLVGSLYTGSIDFGGGPLTAKIADAFVAKFDASGSYLWSRLITDVSANAPDWKGQSAMGVTADGSGNVVVTGANGGTTDLGGGPATSVSAYNDGFVVQYDPSGVYQWASFAGSPGSDTFVTPGSIACDGSGNVAYTGYMRGTVDFGGGPLSGSTTFSIFLSSLDSSGAHRWSHVFVDSIAYDAGTSVAMNASGDVSLTGYIGGPVDFGGGTRYSPNSFDGFLAKFSTNGVHQWSSTFGPGSQYGQGTAITSTGDVLMTGEFYTTINFGGGTFTTDGSTDAYLAKFGEEEPIPTLITKFDAVQSGQGIDVRWQLWSDEALESFALYRSEGSSSRAIAIASGPIEGRTHSYLDKLVGPGKTYRYQLLVTTGDGNPVQSPMVTITTRMPAAVLGQNHPNPFNPTTSIEYTVRERTAVAIGIYDAAGALVTRLDGGTRNAGTYHIDWNGRDQSGRTVGSGVYFYRLEGDPGIAARKMVLLK